MTLKGGTLRSNNDDGPCIAHVHQNGGLYLLNATYHTHDSTPAHAMLTKSPSMPLSLNTWHCRLGHAGFSTIMKAAGHIDGMTLDTNTLHHNTDGGDSIHCISCIMGKQKCLPFPAVARHAKAVAELIHSDVWGPVNIVSSTGDYYFVVFTDDYTRYSAVYLMCTKSKVFDRFKHFAPWIETQSGERCDAQTWLGSRITP
jgi:hypothetical protein